MPQFYAARTQTASEKLMMLGLPAMLRLTIDHLRIRSTTERLDPDELRGAAHQLLELASQSERETARETRHQQYG